MSSSWRREIEAVFLKELQSELRSRSGLVTSGLFSLVTVVTLSLAAYNMKLDRSLAAALIWISILFASLLALPRTFLAEEEQGTADFLRLTARPQAVIWGKTLFNVLHTLLAGAVLSFLFFGFTGTALHSPSLYFVSLLGGCTAIAGAITLCGALACRANNRHVLAGAIGAPLLLPLVALGVSAVRVAIGPVESDAVFESGLRAGVGLIGYAVLTLLLGPPLYASVWKS